jgi:signal transduction histidine kinase
MKGKIAQSLFLVFFLQTFLLQGNLFGHFQTVKGVLDLRDHGFSKDNIYSLRGEWEFYWQKFIEPDASNTNALQKPDLYGKVPSYWTDYSINGQPLPGFGYGSYRLLILLPPGFQEDLVFDVPVFDSSFKLFINGEVAGSNGTVGSTPPKSKAEYAPFLLQLHPRHDTIEVIVQASNFQHRRGGFWKQMKVGLAVPLIQEHQRYVFASYLSMGVLMSFSLFFFFFFLFYRENKIPLLFSIFLAGIFIRLICTGIYPIRLISDISWDWMIRLEYMGMYAAFAAGMWFIHFLYPFGFMKKLTIFNTAVLILFLLFIPFAKVDVFAYTMLYFQYLVIIYLLFYIACSFIAIFTKATVNVVYFAGFLILFSALLNDIVLANSKGAFSSNYTIHIAVQVFIFIHAVMLIRTWIQAFIEKGKLNREIEYMNTNLEKLILERTAELQESSRKLVIQSEKIAHQNEQLKDEIDFKNRVFSIIAHDLKSPISNLLLFFDVMKQNIDNDVKDSALDSIHKLAVSAFDLIENLLVWGKSQGNKISVNNRNINLEEITLKVIELFTEPAKQKSVELVYNKTANPVAFCDPELIQIVIRNLVANAIKFTGENGKITISIDPVPQDMSFIGVSISDTGIGIPEEKLKMLQEGQNLESTYGTSREKGTGLGLRICFDLVKLINGKMEVKSHPDSGTTVIIAIPSAIHN